MLVVTLMVRVAVVVTVVLVAVQQPTPRGLMLAVTGYLAKVITVVLVGTHLAQAVVVEVQEQLVLIL